MKEARLSPCILALVANNIEQTAYKIEQSSGDNRLKSIPFAERSSSPDSHIKAGIDVGHLMGMIKPVWLAKRPTTSLLLLLLHYFGLVSTSTKDLSTDGAKSPLATLHLLPNVSTLNAPEPPPGFEVSIHYDTRKILNPLGVYLVAIDAMYHYAQIDWKEPLGGGFTLGVDGFDVQIDIEASSATLALETGHLIIGLYDTIVNAAALSRFCETLASLLLYNRQIATLVIETKRPRMLDAGGANDANSTLLQLSSPQSGTMTYPTGKFIDPQEPDFSVTFTYDGMRINSKDIFLVVLNAFTIVAQFDPIAPFASLHVASPSGDCVIDIVGVEDKVNYSYVTNALRIVIKDIMVRLKRFEEIKIELRYKDDLMAEGSIKLAGGGTAEQ